MHLEIERFHFAANFLFYSSSLSLTSHWITMHSGPVKQTNHSPALMFLSNCLPESLCPAHTLILLQCLARIHTHTVSLPVWVNEIANARQQSSLESISADVMSLIWLHIKLWFNVWLRSCGYYGHHWQGFEQADWSSYLNDLLTCLFLFWWVIGTNVSW